MKKLLLTIVIALFAVITLAFAVSAETITVVDGTDDITLGDCVIEGLNKEIPSPSKGFTFVLDTDTQTAKITKWANYADTTLGASFVIPSTVTYNGVEYIVTDFDRVAYGTDNGQGQTNQGNFLLVSVYIPDTVVNIPNSAFDNCKALEYVYIGNGLETWGQKAFYFAGTTVGSYYVDDGTGNKVRIETTGANMGDIKEFVLKSKKVTTLPNSIFHHTEFAVDAYIEMDITQFTVFESYCISLNPYALTNDHWFRGTGLRFDVFDIRNATSIADDAFTNAYGGNVMILYAEQTKYFNCDKIRGGSANYYNPETGNDGTLIIIGGDTPETAKTLGGPIWTSNVYYWYGSTIFMNVIIKGYVNAYEGTDGLANQNGYGIDQVDYFFKSQDALEHYIDSVQSTETLTRYAKNSKGYFNVCQGNGTTKAYNLKYADSVATIEEITNASYIKAPLTYNTIVEGKCTASKLCLVCDTELEKGLDHDLKTTVAYKNGYLSSGLKTVECQRENCSHVKTTELNPVFTFKGYSVNDEATELCVGYYVDNIALNEYNQYNETRLFFGVVATVIDEGEALTLSYDNGSVTANLANTVIAPIDSAYSGFDFKLSGFKDYEDGDTINLKALNLVMCAYAYDGDFYFIGSLDAKNYCEKEASTITFEQIQNKTN